MTTTQLSIGDKIHSYAWPWYNKRGVIIAIIDSNRVQVRLINTEEIVTIYVADLEVI